MNCLTSCRERNFILFMNLSPNEKGLEPIPSGLLSVESIFFTTSMYSLKLLWPHREKKNN
jgi:hypothetical protein